MRDCDSSGLGLGLLSEPKRTELRELSHLITGHLPQVLGDVVIRDLREVGSHVREGEAVTGLDQAKLGQLSLRLKHYKLLSQSVFGSVCPSKYAPCSERSKRQLREG